MTPEVVLVCGVGGVGKTTLAAALGVGHALAGRRVVVLTVDPARRLADALGLALGHEPTPVPLACPGSLHAMMVDQKHAFDEAIERLHPDPACVEDLRENRYYRAVSERLAGAPEYMALETLWRLVESDRWDVIIVDTPPSTDALDVFRAPRRLSRVFGRSVLWVLMRPRSGLISVLTRGGAATLRRLAGDTVVDDIGDFFGLIAGMAEGFAAHAREVAALLASDQARTLLVVDASAPDRADATGFLAALRQEGPHFAGFLVNRVVADPGVAPVLPAVPPPPEIDPAAWTRALDAIRAAATLEARQAHRHREVLDRLRADGSAVWAVPLLDDAPEDVSDLSLLSTALPPTCPPDGGARPAPGGARSPTGTAHWPPDRSR